MYPVQTFSPPTILIDDSRTIVMDANFFTGYRKTAVRSDEILVSILIPFTREVGHVTSAFEVMWGTCIV